MWIRRLPTSKKALGVVAAGLTPGREEPQAVWSPRGRQVAFLSRVDLYVTNLNPAPGTVTADMSQIDLRPCAEECETPGSNLRQIGLAFIQYVQDDDEKSPAPAGVNEALYPYLKTQVFFQVESHPFVYTMPGGTLMASLHSPSETQVGQIDVPCARVVLFADGRVKAFPKAVAP